MLGPPKIKPKMPPGFKVIRGNVVDIVNRVEREVSRRTRRVERSRHWREMTLREAGEQEHTFVGEVLDRARHGDDVAVVWAPAGREPVALANLTGQSLQLHGSADPDTPEGKLYTTILAALVGAFPGLLIYYAILAGKRGLTVICGPSPKPHACAYSVIGVVDGPPIRWLT